MSAFILLLLLYNAPIDRQPWAITWGPWIWVATRLVFIAVLMRNALLNGATRPAWLLAALGAGLNFAVIAANGGYMPQSAEAAVDIWGHDWVAARDAGGKLNNTILMTEATRLNWLGDVIPQPAWLPRANVVSIGDLLLSGGLAWWAFLTTMGDRRAANHLWAR